VAAPRAVEMTGAKEAGMFSATHTTRRSRAGFTLVELLAVIAIIGILAAIVIPNVVRYMARARVTRAVSEVNNAETALVGVLSDTGRSDFRSFLKETERDKLDAWSTQILAGSFAAVRDAAEYYQRFFYEMLRQGRDSEYLRGILDPEVRQKLGTFYMDIGEDPWGERYNFWMGPIRGPVVLRSYRLQATTYEPGALEPGDPDFTAADAYVYGQAAYDDASDRLPGQPRPDDDYIQQSYSGMFNTSDVQGYGYPAPDELPVYIWSSGANLVNDGNLLFQFNLGVDDNAPDFLGGGDDPNNWDNESGWDSAPKS
jgi:prepilin-type N-terminal cleavage/methylation domain-containing protein